MKAPADSCFAAGHIVPLSYVRQLRDNLFARIAARCGETVDGAYIKGTSLHLPDEQVCEKCREKK